MRSTLGLAGRLREARQQMALSQSALARRAGLRPQAVQAIEAGVIRRPRGLTDLAGVLGVRAEWLLWGEAPMAAMAEDAPAYGNTSALLSAEAVACARDWLALEPEDRAIVTGVLTALAARSRRGPP